MLPACFKAYDVRGEFGTELTLDLATRLAQAYTQYLEPRKVVIGHDVRLTSPALKDAMIAGFIASGVQVCDLGLVGTEEVYFATCYGASEGIDGGIMITASHNPIQDNGIKMVGRLAEPIGFHSGLSAIGHLALRADFKKPSQIGGSARRSFLEPYLDHLLSYVAGSLIRPMTVVVNAGNGGAGLIIDALEHRFEQHQIPIQFKKIHHEPNGSFPNGIPNPLLVGNRAVTQQAVQHLGADFGVAWDADFDRCFLFDETGAFIESYYLVGLLAEYFLKQFPGEKIVYDPRLVWNTVEQVKYQGGIPIQSRAGHTYMKETMRAEGAIYGGEMSAHHYFRDFGFCDSGMIPWLLIAQQLSAGEQTLSQRVRACLQNFPCSGEINFQVSNTALILDQLTARFQSSALAMDETDGLSFSFDDWRFNVRPSNTEPLLRLNVETRGDPDLLDLKVSELTELIVS